MTSAAQPWLDDLSEEWIPQPTPDSLAHKPEDYHSTQESQSVPAKPRSRLPRIRQSSGSFSEPSVRGRINELRPSKQRGTLTERSLSDNNIAPAAAFASSELESCRSAAHSTLSELGDPAIDNGTVAYDTVAISPKKEQQSHDTPEWRNRLMNGEQGYADRKDLFAPSGLENMFQKPAGNLIGGLPQPKRKLGMLADLSAMCSSPPPWPAMQDQAIEQKTTGTTNNIQHNKLTKQEEPVNKQHLSIPNPDVARTVSGQIQFENENFSPVYLTTNLKVGPTSQAIPNFRGSELANRLRQIGSPTPSTYQSIQEDLSFFQGRENSSFSRLRDDSLPEGLPAGTPDLACVGQFVEFRRGGYSRDGSFRRRPLSPSPEKTHYSSALQNKMIGEEAEDTEISSQEPAHPKTPYKHQNTQQPSPERAKNSGSPLKLFATHDTYTSNRIQRRLTELEHKSDKVLSNGKADGAQNIRPIPKSTKLASEDETHLHGVLEDPFLEDEISVHRERVDIFGQGDLTEYRFSGAFSVASPQSLETQDNSGPEGSPSIDAAPPGSRSPLKFVLGSSPHSPMPSDQNRKQSGFPPISARSFQRPKFKHHRKSSGRVQKEHLVPEIEHSEGKRGPASPFKNPTPKRRRTINAEDMNEQEGDRFSDSGVGTSDRSNLVVPSINGRKRKDARYDSSNNVADAETLATRHILRPRNPTPSQRRIDELRAEIVEATDAFLTSFPRLNTICEKLESSMISDASFEEAKAVAVSTEVAAFTMGRHPGMRDESRKKSVTTQDFLDEALKIMDYIRTKGRPTSGLGSLEETEIESEISIAAVVQDSQSLTFDRPPSREGRQSAWTEPNKREMQPSVIDHLRRFQENDSDIFLNSSVNSIRYSRTSGVAAPHDDSVVVEQNDIRITDDPTRHSRANDIDDEDRHSQPRTLNTKHSTGSSLAHTLATNASRRSEQVATLAPEAVAHLIPEQVAGMSFDRERNIWVRQRNPCKERHRESANKSELNESEEDPLGNIPDLMTDESIKQAIDVGSEARQSSGNQEDSLKGEKVAKREYSRPVTRDGQEIPSTVASSAPSKVSNFMWSYPKTDTRSTSWSTQAPRNWSTQKQPQMMQTTDAIPESEEDDVEHEIKYFEGRSHRLTTTQQTRLRDITISFAECGIQDMEHSHVSSSERLAEEEWKTLETKDQPHEKRSAWKQLNSARTLPRLRSSRKPFFTGDGDLSLLEEVPATNYRMQLSMSVSAPVLDNGRKDMLLAPPSSPVRDVTFFLSDLPEFTLNQIDECEQPNRVVMKHNGTQFLRAVEDRYEQGTADLVKALQDVEPDEPFWEDLRQVNLHDKDLSSLHRLDDLCYQLEELDVSNNRISQVKGIPYTMRRLYASNNCLTGLTSWPLTNLQHLDISNNDIDCLDGLAELLHLRVLRVNNNKIKSLRGILHLDGLMEINAGGNAIESVDFTHSNLQSLTHLSLSDNRLLEVRNLYRLPQLQHLDLDDNDISEFPIGDALVTPCKLLRSLRFCNNGASLLDVEGHFPNLEALYADRNCLTQILGLETLQHLRTLSAREQVLETEEDTEFCVSNLLGNTEIRSLYISQNTTQCLSFSHHLLSLQRLELANMGLKMLPDDFGQLTPNVRSLNLNFNSLRDLKPLLNIKRLDELLLAGNKLERLRASATVLGKLMTLTKLDWRDNPLTLRFYAPTSENRIMSLRHQPSVEVLTDRFVLPEGDLESDIQHLERLDCETRIRRRVTEMMLANMCRNLQDLDGLRFDKARVLVKDDVWERLLLLGVIQRKQPSKTNGSSES